MCCASDRCIPRSPSCSARWWARERLAHEPKPTDRGAWRLVAVRDFRVRLRDKGFFISTGITLTVLTVFILLRAFGDEVTPSFDLGIIGRDPAAIDRTVAELDDVAEREGVEPVSGTGTTSPMRRPRCGADGSMRCSTATSWWGMTRSRPR